VISISRAITYSIYERGPAETGAASIYQLTINAEGSEKSPVISQQHT
jgi:hypothetical protein